MRQDLIVTGQNDDSIIRRSVPKQVEELPDLGLLAVYLLLVRLLRLADIKIEENHPQVWIRVQPLQRFLPRRGFEESIRLVVLKIQLDGSAKQRVVFDEKNLFRD